MRVLYLTRGYTPHDHRFVSALAASGQEVVYLRLDRRGRVQESRPLPDGVREVAWHRLDRRPGWADLPGLSRALKRVIADTRPDVTHAGPVQGGWAVAALAGAHPLVTMSWGSDLLRDARRGPGRWAARYALRRCDAFVCDCQAVRRAALELGAPGERTVVLPCGVDLEVFSPGSDAGLRARLGWQDACVVISTRGWEKLYGIDVLMTGFAGAAARQPALRLLMLGDGSLRPMVESGIRRAGLADRVLLAGQIGNDALPAFFRAADLYLSASRVDGSSVSLLEAMASGLPALVSDIPGNREWIEPGVNGWWFPDGDAAGLEQALVQAASARGERLRLGQAARAAAEARADWRANFPRLLQAYDLALAFDGAARRRTTHAERN